MGNTKRLLNKEQAACHLEISTRTLERKVKKGIIIPIKRGSKSVRFIKELLTDIDPSLTKKKPA